MPSLIWDEAHTISIFDVFTPKMWVTRLIVDACQTLCTRYTPYLSTKFPFISRFHRIAPGVASAQTHVSTHQIIIIPCYPVFQFWMLCPFRWAREAWKCKQRRKRFCFFFLFSIWIRKKLWGLNLKCNKVLGRNAH